MRKFLFFFFALIFLQETISFAQTRYIIRLKDKANNPYSLNAPDQFLSQRSLDRRILYDLTVDSSDMPVTPAYIDSIRLSGNVSILNVSKWLNLVSIKTSDAAALSKINAFPFVLSVTAFASRPKLRPAKPFYSDNKASLARPSGVNGYYSYGQSFNQIRLNNGDFLHNHGFRGANMQIAVLDAGFSNYQTLITFDSVRNNNQILNTWDFIDHEIDVNDDYQHGAECFSTIAANLPGSFVGTAPKASFYLYRTEDAYTENILEELNWAAGAERADSAGTNVISSSLGYNTFDGNIANHTYSDMTGDKTICANASDLAAKKGILVVNAIGNTGNDPWHYLVTPADADSCLAIGAIKIDGTVSNFSAFGPSYDGQIKPDLVTLGEGTTIVNTVTGQPTSGNGTSFATPIISGIATCLWEAFPEVNNMTIIDALRKSADEYTTPDNRSGYGIPDAKKAFVDLIKQLHTQQFTISKCAVNLKWTAKCAADMNFVVERKLPTDVDFAVVATKTNEGAFAVKNFVFNDDLSNVTYPAVVSYRIKMNIASDTSFYLDSVSLNYQMPCYPYVFEGNGNWDLASNWSNNTIPPAILPAGSKIIINPLPNGKCILNQSQHIAAGAILLVLSEKQLLVEGALEIEE
ncbi:S8 family serine peptidase [Ferruginibacter sp. SUN002]|uniref:S8 family serine peptidase n=1 Tax=Ferruginibacter sp. SUN002 TaxID=2937789 RepID=UPI003D36D800